jgi:hypothetical protein
MKVGSRSVQVPHDCIYLALQLTGNEGFVLELGHECVVTEGGRSGQRKKGHVKATRCVPLEDDDNDGANKSNDGSKLAERTIMRSQSRCWMPFNSRSTHA